MRAKDTARLSVLRSLLSSTLNASKTSSPINTDLQMLSLLRKSSAQGKTASEEFRKNGREDLAAKEEAQVGILEEYAGGVEVVGEGEIRGVVEGVVN
ncbi:Altered inheritance of mitochondria protein, partial [Lachnellula suecica]